MKRVIPFFALLLLYGTAHADVDSRKVGDFHGVELAGALPVDVVVGKSAGVEISGEADLLARVTTVVDKGVLVIKTSRDLEKSHHNHLKATVSVPALTVLTLSGAGPMTVTTVDSSDLTIRLSGAGPIKVSGTTGTLHVVLDGTGQVDTKQLKAKTATIELQGTGQVSANASESVDANLSGTGEILVAGNPAKVKKNQSGTGSIRIH